MNLYPFITVAEFSYPNHCRLQSLDLTEDHVQLMSVGQITIKQ